MVGFKSHSKSKLGVVGRPLVCVAVRSGKVSKVIHVDAFISSRFHAEAAARLSSVKHMCKGEFGCACHSAGMHAVLSVLLSRCAALRCCRHVCSEGHVGARQRYAPQLRNIDQGVLLCPPNGLKPRGRDTKLKGNPQMLFPLVATK